MKRKSLVIAIVGIVLFSSCSKNEKRCPDGYAGADCLVPWSTNVIGVWKDNDRTIFDDYTGTVYPFNIIPSNSNPKAIKIQYPTGDYEDIIGNMTDSASFSIDAGVLWQDGNFKQQIISGNGRLSNTGFDITGTMVIRVTDDINNVDTTYNLNYVWKK